MSRYAGRDLGPMTFDKPAQSKLRGGARLPERLRDMTADLIAIIEVSEAGCLPPGVQLRERITPTLVTAVIPRAVLEAVLADDRVVLVESATELRPLD